MRPIKICLTNIIMMVSGLSFRLRCTLIIVWSSVCVVSLILRGLLSVIVIVVVVWYYAFMLDILYVGKWMVDLYISNVPRINEMSL